VDNQHRQNTRSSGDLGLVNHLANPDIFLVVFTRLFHPSAWSFVRPVSQRSPLHIAFITSRKQVFFATFYFHSDLKIHVKELHDTDDLPAWDFSFEADDASSSHSAQSRML
jgi:hypothetical protein